MNTTWSEFASPKVTLPVVASVVNEPAAPPPVTSVKNARVPLPSCIVIVLSAVGFVTVNVVSKLFELDPSKIIELSDKFKPDTTGLVNVLFVSVSVVALPTNVSVAFGNVTVLSAVGSVTVKVVSKLSAVLPSKIMLPVVVVLPVIAGVVNAGLVNVLFVKV